ncbi:urease accessory protein UreF [Corynebacterium comes]|uniref:Urease accessory protein UreF n=1 Tax=Corynebacterium comes TaxID=2675218 RepID=A0A6B8W2H4_9CORY|nr:urease accessory UreF family protein [Corynebacterium comes]QGU05625.1 Urease accessory protein UreF [Corynebacterium comes]
MPGTPTSGQVSSPHALLTMLHLTDSALPTGGFSHSLGLESYLQRDLVNSPETFSRWMYAYIRQTSYNDALVAKLTAEAVAQPHEEAVRSLKLLDALAHTTLVPRQIRDANASMGLRMCKIIAVAVPDHPLIEWYTEAVTEGHAYGCPALAHGLALSAVGLDTQMVVRSYLMQTTASLTQNAIRGIPIGQDAGQRALVGSYPVIEEAVAATLRNGYLDLGAAAPGLEIAQMQHESLRSRMFMS